MEKGHPASPPPPAGRRPGDSRRYLGEAGGGRQRFSPGGESGCSNARVGRSIRCTCGWEAKPRRPPPPPRPRPPFPPLRLRLAPGPRRLRCGVGTGMGGRMGGVGGGGSGEVDVKSCTRAEGGTRATRCPSPPESSRRLFGARRPPPPNAKSWRKGTRHRPRRPRVAGQVTRGAT